MSAKLYLGAISVSLLLRYLVSRFPHSGQSQPPLYGDYEAQRHWMEITTNLKPGGWYENSTNNDLQYWGLDYPPLTAYHMLFTGILSNQFNTSWTKLHESRGIDTYEHKLFMRATVLLSDAISFIPAIIYYFSHTSTESNQLPTNKPFVNTALFCMFALTYPAQILVDHGHFQYNCVFMGLVIWATILVGLERHLSASLVFTLALNYKQMSLYYSLPFFWYLLSVSLRRRPIPHAIARLVLISFTVAITFLICWSPFLSHPRTFLQVLRRLFPFNRGLFEDKVANIWCCLSILIKFKQVYEVEQLLRISTLLTLILTLPSGIHLLMKPSLRAFKYSLINCSLVFFLYSFQVHEKTILVPAVPILLMFREHPLSVSWFMIISTFSLQPLMAKDQLMIPYASLLVIYIILSTECFRKQIVPDFNSMITLEALTRLLFFISIFGGFVLNTAAMIVTPPTRYPDLHPTLNCIYSCFHFHAFLIFFYYQQFKTSGGTRKRKKTD